MQTSVQRLDMVNAQVVHVFYPIEIQFNEWLHLFLYKYVSDSSVGVQLKSLYDAGVIVTENDFRKEMHKLCVTL